MKKPQLKLAGEEKKKKKKVSHIPVIQNSYLYVSINSPCFLPAAPFDQAIKQPGCKAVAIVNRE